MTLFLYSIACQVFAIHRVGVRSKVERPMPIHCHICGAEDVPLFFCQDCMSAIYCSVTCQDLDLDVGHLNTCGNDVIGIFGPGVAPKGRGHTRVVGPTVTASESRWGLSKTKERGGVRPESDLKFVSFPRKAEHLVKEWQQPPGRSHYLDVPWWMKYVQSVPGATDHHLNVHMEIAPARWAVNRQGPKQKHKGTWQLMGFRPFLKTEWQVALVDAYAMIAENWRAVKFHPSAVTTPGEWRVWMDEIFLSYFAGKEDPLKRQRTFKRYVRNKLGKPLARRLQLTFLMLASYAQNFRVDELSQQRTRDSLNALFVGDKKLEDTYFQLHSRASRKAFETIAFKQGIRTEKTGLHAQADIFGDYLSKVAPERPELRQRLKTEYRSLVDEWLKFLQTIVKTPTEKQIVKPVSADLLSAWDQVTDRLEAISAILNSAEKK